MGMGADELIDPAVIGQHFRVFVFFILNFTLLNGWVINVIPVTSFFTNMESVLTYETHALYSRMLIIYSPVQKA